MTDSEIPSRIVKCKPDFDECMARVNAWYRQEMLDRPPVRFHHHNMEYERHRIIEGHWRSKEDRWLDVNFQVQTFIDSLRGTRFVGETFPVFWPNLSAVVYNLFLGQQAEFDDVTAWVHPCVKDIHNPPPLRVNWNNVYFNTIEALTHRALELCEERYLVGYTDMYAGIDSTMSALGAEQMCLYMMTEPDSVKKLIGSVFSEYKAVYDHFDRILKKHNHLSATWTNLPSFETFNVLACDFAVYVSPRHFDEFCMPIIRREAELFTHNVFHMDGPGVAKNIDSILTLPNLAAVQWVQGYGRDRPIMQWVPLIKKVQEAGKSVIVDLQLDELDEFMKAVDPKGIMLWTPALPKDQADVIQKINKW